MKNKKIVLIIVVIIILLLMIVGLLALDDNGLVKNVRLTKEEYNERQGKEGLSKMYSTYEIVEENENMGNAIIEFNSELGIQYIKYPKDYEFILQCNGKKNIAIDYNVEDEKEYIFKVKEIDKEEQEYILNVKIDSQINEYQESKYFVIKSEGIELTRNVNIDYQYKDECKNYYSLDNGETWEEYKGELKFKEYETNIKLKSETDQNIITKKENKDISIELEKDALRLTEDNGKFSARISNGAQWSSKFILVDSSAIGKEFKFSMSPLSLAYGMTAIGRFKDIDDNILEQEYKTVYSKEFSVIIPENAVKFEIRIYQGYNISIVL